jgi:hypothetical protein
MSVIGAAENNIGSLDTWPSRILEYLFCEIPTPGALLEYIAFCYGNGIPRSKASQLYHACNTQTTASVTEEIYETYSRWDSCSYKGLRAIFYHMSLRRYVYLNGLDGNPFESFPHAPPVKLGIDNTPYPTMIRSQLSRALSVPYY